MNEVEMAKQRRGEKRRRKGLSVFRLKMIGALFMALGVAGVSVLPSMLGDPTQDMAALTVVVACTAASWCAIPIYSWLLFDGYRHTGSIGKYVLRLFIVAVVSDVPYDLIMTGKPFDLSAQNSVYGLVIALVVLMLVDWIAYQYGGESLRPWSGAQRGGAAAVRWLLTIVVILAGPLWALLLRVGVDQRIMYTGVLTLLFVLVFYFLNARENTMMFTAGLLGAVMCITPGIGVAFLHYRNDEVGFKQSWTKWAWYAVYPVLLIIGALD